MSGYFTGCLLIYKRFSRMPEKCQILLQSVSSILPLKVSGYFTILVFLENITLQIVWVLS